MILMNYWVLNLKTNLKGSPLLISRLFFSRILNFRIKNMSGCLKCHFFPRLDLWKNIFRNVLLTSILPGLPARRLARLSNGRFFFLNYFAKIVWERVGELSGDVFCKEYLPSEKDISLGSRTFSRVFQSMKFKNKHFSKDFWIMGV